MKKIVTILSMIVFCIACNDNANEKINNSGAEPIVTVPASLSINLDEGNSATFSTSEHSYISAIFVLGEELELDQSEILGWRDEDNAILVWSCKGEVTEVPYTHSSKWYDIEQIDNSNYEVTIGNINELRHIYLYLKSRVNHREPAVFDITINPASNK